jgi:hypothetical protein
LFGSGISISAGMPRTQEITERILSGEGIMHHTDGNYYFGKPLYSHLGWPDEHVPRIVEFLHLLKAEVDEFYQKRPFKRNISYEDLYYVAGQVCDSEIGEYDNPAVQPLIDKILPKIKPLLFGKENEIRKEWELYELAEEATNYIHDVVWHLLNKETTSLDYLNCIKNCCQDSEISKVDLFTLNHDIVLEECLKGIPFADGFEESINNVRYWNPDLFERESFKVRLFKLHGAINWFRFRPTGGDGSDDKIGLPLKWGIEQITNAVERRPIFLVGTFNKMLEYTGGMYADIAYQFYCSLRHVKNLIICGYSFGDRGINTRIIDWINLSSDYRIIVIHPEPENLKNDARGSIRNKWDKWINKGKLTIIEKRIEKTSWQDLKDILFKDFK